MGNDRTAKYSPRLLLTTTEILYKGVTGYNFIICNFASVETTSNAALYTGGFERITCKHQYILQMD